MLFTEKPIGSEDDDCGFDIFTVEFKDKKFTYHNIHGIVQLKRNKQC